MVRSCNGFAAALKRRRSKSVWPVSSSLLTADCPLLWHIDCATYNVRIKEQMLFGGILIAENNVLRADQTRSRPEIELKRANAERNNV